MLTMIKLIILCIFFISYTITTVGISNHTARKRARSKHPRLQRPFHLQRKSMGLQASSEYPINFTSIIGNDIANEENLFHNDEESTCVMPEIVIGLKGEHGEKGERGIRGNPGREGILDKLVGSGFKGEIGDTGIEGDLGQIGNRGESGFPGISGEMGIPGEMGDKGTRTDYLAGEYGRQGFSGAKGTKGSNGESKPYVVLMPPQNFKVNQENGVFKILHKPKKDGSKSFPGRTCADIMEDYSSFKSGKYWINPNGRTISDAVEVHCDMRTGETCISAIPEQSPNIINVVFEDLNVERGYVWLSEVSNGFRINYNASNNQIRFLQLLLPIAEQSITFNCKSTTDSFKNNYINFTKPLKILAWNDAILPAEKPREGIQHLFNCGNQRRRRWTLFHQTDKSTRLPIVDVAIPDFGENKSFSITIGRACFRRYQKQEDMYLQPFFDK